MCPTSREKLDLSSLGNIDLKSLGMEVEMAKLYAYMDGRRPDVSVPLKAVFESLGDDSATLLGISSFLAPKRIPESIFVFDPQLDDGHVLGPCIDENRVAKAEAALIDLKLWTRDSFEKEAILVTQDVQTQFLDFTGYMEYYRYFALAVKLLERAFPSESGPALQMYDQWGTCEKLLPHVLSLKNAFKGKNGGRRFSPRVEFCNLLAKCQRYMVEIHSLDQLEDVCAVNRQAISILRIPVTPVDSDISGFLVPKPSKKDPTKLNSSQATDLECTILSHLAIMHEALGDFSKAIETGYACYRLREKEEPQSQIYLSWTMNNIGYAYNSANNHEAAKRCFERARQHWESQPLGHGDLPVPWPAVQKSNLGRCLLYLNQLDEAKALFEEALADMESILPLNRAMMAYTYFALGILQIRRGNRTHAEQNFNRVLDAWLELPGWEKKEHPFWGACLYRLACCKIANSKFRDAALLLHNSIRVTKAHEKSMPVEHARNLYKLAEVLEGDEEVKTMILGFARAGYENTEEYYDLEGMRERAETMLERVRPEVGSVSGEGGFDGFVPICWR